MIASQDRLFQRIYRRLQDGKTTFTVFGYFASIIYAMAIIIPLYYIFVSAFKDNAQIFNTPLALPSQAHLTNFIRAEKVARLGRAIGISASIAAGSEVIVLLLAFPAAYAIARIKTPLTPWVEGLFSLGFLIPVFAMLVPVFMLIAQLGLLRNPLALVVFYPAWRLPSSIVLLASYLRTIPIELEESAVIDGASRLQMIRHIFFPLARPGVVTVLVLNFIDIWNEYLFALILLSQNNRTVQLAVAAVKAERSVDFGLLAAGVIISIVPVYIVFIIFQEQVVRGLFAGAVKG